jgi:hypothetical protein
MAEADNKRLEEIVDSIKASVDKVILSNVRDHNIVFRQMASQLILVAGIFLALSAQLSFRLTELGWQEKLLILLIIIFLSASILFGILQHFLESIFFKKLAIGNAEVRSKLKKRDAQSIASFDGSYKQFHRMMGGSTKRWPTYVQMSLLTISFILISIVASIELFK